MSIVDGIFGTNLSAGLDPNEGSDSPRKRNDDDGDTGGW